MHRSTPSPLLPLLLSSLLSLHHLTSAGGSGSPDDFNLACITAVASFPERQDTVAFLDAYDSSSDTMTVFQVGWMWIDNGVCDNSLIICSNFSSADSNQLQIQSFSFSPGQNDPVHVETSFMCEMCPACVLRIDVFSDSTTIETVNINCDGSAQTNDLTQNEDFVRVQYSVTFDNSSTATQCVTIDSYRIWQYQDCPATVFQLANYQQTDPGIGPVDSTGCVANAQSDGTARAGCSGDSVWGTVVGDSAPCNCLAGFTPNNDLTACEACGAGLFKATVGNEQCEPCTNGQVPNSGRTGCGCAPGYTGPSCGECVENFFMTSGGACDPCPSGSVREVGHEMTSCTCTGNLVNDESSPTTICSMCATGYYRESSKSPSEPCNLCNTSYFRVEEECRPCPGGSSRDIDDPEGSCTCNSALVTSGGSISTSDGPCNNCPKDMLLYNGDCVMCPDFSGRELSSPPGVCECETNAATPVNGATSTSDPNGGCTACIGGFSRPSAGDSCQGITVEFSQDEYSVTESEIANLTVVASPPPGENQDISVTINPRSLSASTSELKLTSSAPSFSFNVSGYNDSLGLQDTRQFMVSMITPTVTDTTMILVTDDDVVHATFEKTNYVVGEGEGTFQVCVVLSIAAVRNVTVMVTGELSLDSGANSAAELGTLSVEVTIPPNDTGSCLSFTPSDDSEVEDVDEQYRLTMTKVSPDDPRFEVDGDVFTIVTITDNDADEPGSNLLPLIVGASVGGALLAVILAVLCIVCLCIWSVNVKRQGFYHTHEDSQAAPTMLRYSASLRSISSQSVVVMEGKRAAAKENEFFV